jgi:hypothetical protein
MDHGGGMALNFSSVFNEKVPHTYIHTYIHIYICLQLVNMRKLFSEKLFYCKLLYDDNFKYVWYDAT